MDHDRLFKQLLTTFFTEFMDAFFPEFSKHIDRGGVQFLDKEIFTDLASGERHEVDLLVKAKYQSQEVFFLIHVENQSTHERDYPQRIREQAEPRLYGTDGEDEHRAGRPAARPVLNDAYGREDEAGQSPELFDRDIHGKLPEADSRGIPSV